MKLTLNQIKELMKAEGLKIINNTSIGLYAKERGYKKRTVISTIYEKEKP